MTEEKKTGLEKERRNEDGTLEAGKPDCSRVKRELVMTAEGGVWYFSENLT